MKIPSISVLLAGAKKTFLRFPFVVLSSAAGAIIMAYIVHLDYPQSPNTQYLYNAAMSCSLGIPLLLSLSFISERYNSSRINSITLQVVGVVLLIAYYFSLPGEITYVDITRYILLVIGLHLLVSFSMFISSRIFTSGDIEAFWKFNEALFIRILITVVYSGVLYAGLSIAIFSFDKLFNTNINGKIYGQLFFIIIGVFNTWFFLSDMPDVKESSDNITEYPKGLKIFTQYVLLPLVIIYLLILYLYTGKILIEWSLPMGWVSYLILGFSITGIFSLLLIHPLRNSKENSWIKIFWKWFYIALYPLIVLLFVAILRRTNEYGITERRYLVFGLALWLTGIAIYFTFSKAKNIKIIPISLCILSFISTFGPWSAFSISEKSQVNRLENILINNKILIDGKIKKSESNISEKEEKDINSVLNYLAERKSLKAIQPWFDLNLDNLKDTMINNTLKKREALIVELMGLKYYSPWTYQTDRSFSFLLKDYDSFKLRDYNYLFIYKFDVNDTQKNQTIIKIDSLSFEISKSEEKNILEIKQMGKSAISIDLTAFIEQLKKSNSPSPTLKDMTIEARNEYINVKFVIVSMWGQREGEKLKINHLNGYMFIK